MAARLAAKCEVQFAYAIGHPDPVSVHVETFGTNAVPNEKIIRAINRVFDFQPASIIDHLKLRVRSIEDHQLPTRRQERQGPDVGGHE